MFDAADDLHDDAPARLAGTPRRPRAPTRLMLRLQLLLLPLALAGCGSLLGPGMPPPHRWSLDGAADIGPVTGASAPLAPPVLVVTPPTAAPGFTTDRMIYLRAPQQPQPYADNAWVDAPARLLGPLVVEALQRSGAFAAVVASPGSAAGTLQLDVQVLRLQHELHDGAGRVRVTLRATLVDKRGPRQRVTSRDLEAVVPTASDDAPGAARAAQAAVREVLRQLATACVAVAAAAPAAD